jgi:hypothetical protein
MGECNLTEINLALAILTLYFSIESILLVNHKSKTTLVVLTLVNFTLAHCWSLGKVHFEQGPLNQDMNK